MDFNTPIFDDTRFAETVFGSPVAQQKKGILNNRGRFSKQILGLAPFHSEAVKTNNTDAGLYLTKAFAAPGVMFQATIETNQSYCLTYFQRGNSLWAREVPEE